MILEKFLLLKGKEKGKRRSLCNRYSSVSAGWDYIHPKPQRWCCSNSSNSSDHDGGEAVDKTFLGGTSALHQLFAKSSQKASQASVQTDTNQGDVYSDYCRFYKLFSANLQESKNVYGDTLSDISRLTNIEPPACIPSNKITYLWRQNCKMHKTSLSAAGITFFWFLIKQQQQTQQPFILSFILKQRDNTWWSYMTAT